MRIGEVARAAHVNLQTLRYYERRGLLPEPRRTNGGHRDYPQEAVVTLRVIKAAQRLGFTLAEVADLLEVGHHHHGGIGPGLRARARDKIAEVDVRIDDLRTIRATLVAALDAGCTDLLACAGSEDCPIPFVEIAASAPADA